MAGANSAGYRWPAKRPPTRPLYAAGAELWHAKPPGGGETRAPPPPTPSRRRWTPLNILTERIAVARALAAAVSARLESRVLGRARPLNECAENHQWKILPSGGRSWRGCFAITLSDYRRTHTRIYSFEPLIFIWDWFTHWRDEKGVLKNSWSRWFFDRVAY